MKINNKDLESSVIFPISRAFFLIVALIMLVTVGFSLLRFTFAGLKPTMTKVTSEDVKAVSNPLANSEKAPDPTARSQMPGAGDSVQSRLYNLLLSGYNGSATSEQKDQLYDKLDLYISEAVTRGDKQEEYCQNAIDALTPIEPARRISSYKIYHNKRMALLRDYKERLTAEAETRNFYKYLGLFSFAALLQISLILAMFAIERNTRNSRA